MAANARASSTPPVTTATRSRSNVWLTISFTSSALAGASSDGFRMARLPAARMSASGPTERSMGKFHGDRFPTTPLGWYMTYVLLGRRGSGWRASPAASSTS